MPLIKSITASPEDELRALVAAGVGDLRVMDFRPELPEPTEAGRIEFLNDVSSFANALGGHILYGATAIPGEPVELRPFEPRIVRDRALWLEHALVGGISPNLPGLRFKVVELENQKAALVVHIPRSWAGPHLVVGRDTNNFFSRDHKGRYLLDVSELRAAFLMGHTLRERLRNFRLDRLNVIRNRALSVNLSEAPKMVLHILPVASFAPGFHIDISQLDGLEPQLMRPMQARGLVTHFNYDGMITFSSVEKYAYSYVQVFRNGCLEAGETLLLELRDGRKYIPGGAFEREVIQCGERMVGLLKRMEVEPPYVVMLSFLGVHGYSLFVGAMRWQSNTHQIERQDLYLEDVVIQDAAQDFSRVIRPAFDQVWNACGWPRSMNYDTEGNWHEQTK